MNVIDTRYFVSLYPSFVGEYNPSGRITEHGHGARDEIAGQRGASLARVVCAREPRGRVQELLAHPVVHATDAPQAGAHQSAPVPPAPHSESPGAGRDPKPQKCSPVHVVQRGVVASWRLRLSHGSGTSPGTIQ